MARPVTVIFADLSGFTALAERLDPEDLTAVMEKVYACMGEPTLAHMGVIQSFQGDAIIALFGLTPGDDAPAASALRAARGMVDRVQVLRRKERLQLAISAGLAAGIIQVDEPRDPAELARPLAPAIQAASDLEKDAQDFEILADEATRTALKGRAVFRGARFQREIGGQETPTGRVATMVRRRLQGQIQDAVRSLSSQERRRVAVLFARVAPPKASLARMAAQERSHLAQRCEETLRESVVRYGGTVDKPLADGLLALRRSCSAKTVHGASPASSSRRGSRARCKA